MLSASVPVATLQPETGLTLGALAKAKGLPVDLLGKFGCSDTKRRGVSAVRIEYRNVAGDVAGVRFRSALTGPNRFQWSTGSKTSLYPLDRLAEIRQRGWVLVVEGESDVWTGSHHDVPVIGIPGKTVWRDEWATLLEGIQLVVWQEPEAGDLTARIAKTRPDLVVIECPPYKDLSEAHLANADVPALVANLREQARPWSEIVAERLDARRTELRTLAGPVLDHHDPLELITDAIRGQGYGGDLTPPLIVYLAATSRLLAMRTGSMPLHLLLVGTSSSGKTYTVDSVLRLMPPEAQHTISAGSPRALIYSDANLAHVVLVFGEADSLPSDEDNPAASAIRNLLQDHQLHYDVVVRNPDTGEFETRHIRKAGPTVMLTTSTRKLRDHQMDTRVFSMEIPEHIDKIRAALRVQARLQREPAPEPDPALLAFQSHLQVLAPWDVDVPYLDTLAELIGRSVSASRVLRDFGRITALIKSIAVLRHTRRERNGQGWVVATLEDYGTALSLVGDMYSASVTGASDGVRRVVLAVAALGRGCNQQAVTAYLGPETNKGSVSRWVKEAIGKGWLVKKLNRIVTRSNWEIQSLTPRRCRRSRPLRRRSCGLHRIPTEMMPVVVMIYISVRSPPPRSSRIPRLVL